MSDRGNEQTDDVITQFLRTRSADPDFSLLDDIVRTAGATAQVRPWLGLGPMFPPPRTLLIVVSALLLATIGAIGVGSQLLQRDPLVITFGGTWISTSDADGGTQTMSVEVSGDGTVEVTVHDTIASVCSSTPSTMTGTGATENSARIVIAEPVYTCDNGSRAVALSEGPLADLLRNWTLTLNAQTGTLTDNAGGIWYREGAPAPSPPSSSPPKAWDQTWPQTSLEEVMEAQERADAGDPAYTWQVDEQLASNDNLYPWDSEIVRRFAREKLGWEAWAIGRSGIFAGQPGGPYDEVVLIRCAPGRTNALYADMPSNDMPSEVGGDIRGCAPTIDDFRYETVSIGLEQAGQRGPSGVWVVTGWAVLQPVEPQSLYEHLYPHFELRQVEQQAPPSDAAVTALLEAFLEARVGGEGAERYVHRHPDGWDDEEAPIMYATTGGSPYVRYEFDQLQGPVWPSGWVEVRVRLFAEDGTQVEQSFMVVRQEADELGLMYGLPFDREFFPTTENGEPVRVPYRLLDGEVTFAAALPWSETLKDRDSITLGGVGRGSAVQFTMFTVVADPRTATGCEAGPVAPDVEALLQRIQSNPDLESTDPVTVSVGGMEARQVDVVGLRQIPVGGCLPIVLEHLGLGQDDRMRLYLVDLPDGMSARVMAIAINALNSEFELVLEAATPVLDSFEFHLP